MRSEILVFIHGWASVPDIWETQKEYFSRNYEVILPDIGPARDIQEAAGLVRDAIQGSDDFVLAGWSLGWLAVLEGLKSFSLKPKAVVAVNSTPKFCSHEYLGAGSTKTHLDKMIRDCRRDPRKTMENFYKGMLTDNGKSMANSFQFKNIDYSKLMYGLSMLRDADYRDFIGTIDIPALIITGARDNICVPQVSEYMRQRIKQSDLKVFDCGHLPFLDKADEFNSAVDDFIKKLK
ncbi:MAG: alpha/beta hydrolase [Candidatus Omnitrophota bacterium]